ncbi:MAG TPA: hypothetical protein VFN57_01300 [Thermomicrobiaceae bacterium]|nr:hypothetical protein [Thermomicrobiaceae bacterium]
MSGTTRMVRPRRAEETSAERRPRPVARPARRYFALNGAAMVTIAAAALTVIGILYLIQIAHVASLGYQLSRLQNERDTLSIENARLDYQVAQFESLDTIDQIATQKLGMTPLGRHQFMQVQVPPSDQLSPVPALQAPPETALSRIWHALAGIGRGQAPAVGPPALPAGATR